MLFHFLSVSSVCFIHLFRQALTCVNMINEPKIILFSQRDIDDRRQRKNVRVERQHDVDEHNVDDNRLERLDVVVGDAFTTTALQP